jgi:hypothetical protein
MQFFYHNRRRFIINGFWVIIWILNLFIYLSVENDTALAIAACEAFMRTYFK